MGDRVGGAYRYEDEDACAWGVGRVDHWMRAHLVFDVFSLEGVDRLERRLGRYVLLRDPEAYGWRGVEIDQKTRLAWRRYLNDVNILIKRLERGGR